MNDSPEKREMGAPDELDSPFVTDMRSADSADFSVELSDRAKNFKIEIPDEDPEPAEPEKATAEADADTDIEGKAEAPAEAKAEGEFSDKTTFGDEYDVSTFTFEQAEEAPSDEADGKAEKRRKGKKDKKDPKSTRRRRRIAKILLTVFLVGLISVCMIVGGVAVYLLNFMDNSIGVDLDDLKLNFTTTVYVKNDAGEYVEYQRVHGPENRLWVSIDKIPKHARDAVIAIEDERFESHHGVDWKRTIAATVNSFFHYSDNEFGGSTITQQLVKNLTDDRDKTPVRKIREMLRAIELEKYYSKDTIMECYLNTIPLGGSCYGIEVAAQYYFGKHASELTLAECALIAGITNSPNNYRPDTKFENGWKRATVVLDKMLELGSITKEEHDAALAEKIIITADKNVLKENEINSWFVDTLITQVAEDLAEKYGYTQQEALKNVYNGGYKIYSTLEPKAQEVLEKAALNPDIFLITGKNGDKAQIGMAVLNYKGEIVACVGGAGKKEGNRLLDRAYSVPNQPGSAIKPIGVYAQAIEENIITYSSVLEDSPVAKLDDRDWPVNFYEGYTGNNTVAHAIARSINTIPVKILQQLGVEKSYRFLTEKLHFRYLNPGPSADESLSALAIGGTNGGTTPVEMAGAFTIFGNGGKFYVPKTYTKVTNQKGTEVILEVKDNDYEQVISPETAEIMNQLLQNAVYGLDGTAWMLQGVAGNGMKAFGKSGTSSNYFDNWLVGGTPYYCGAVWYGFDTPESTDETYVAKFTLRDILTEISKGKEYKDYPHSEGVIAASYCNATGLRAASGCWSTFTGYYKTDYTPGWCYGSHYSPTPTPAPTPTPTPTPSSEPSDTSSEEKHSEETQSEP